MKRGWLDRQVDRRTLVAIVPAGLLGACAPSRAPASPASSTTPTSAVPTSPPATTGALPAGPKRTVSAPATLAPTALSSEDRSRLVATFAGRRPARWGVSLPGVVETVPTSGPVPRLALTFDACGGPGGSGFDAALIGLLRRHEVAATLFLNGRWVRANPSVARDLAADPLFAIGDHGVRHRPLSVTGRAAYGIRGTSSVGEVIDEVSENRELLGSLTGVAPAWFRTGTAWYDDVAVDLTDLLGIRIAGFAVNADAGATASPAQVAASLRAAPGGSIVLMHMNQPGHGTFRGVAAALPVLCDRGTRFVHLT